jgi:hypothetical protein
LRCRLDRAAYETFDLVDELLRVEGLLDEVVGPRTLPFVGVVRLLFGRKEENGDCRVLRLDLGADGVASWPVQRDVAENYAGSLGSELRKASVGALGADDAKILAGEGHLQDFAHRDAVVDGEQGRGHGKFSSLRSKMAGGARRFRLACRVAGV